MIDMRQRHPTVGHSFGANFKHMHSLVMIHIAHDTYDRHETKSHKDATDKRYACTG